MKPIRFLICKLGGPALIALGVVGCGKSMGPVANSVASAATSGLVEVNGSGETLSVSYKPGQGLWVPEVTRRSLVLQIVEVSERSVANRLSFQLQVYRAANEGGRTDGRVAAVGMIPTDDAKHLKSGQSLTLRTEGAPPPVAVESRVKSVGRRVLSEPDQQQSLNGFAARQDGLALPSRIPDSTAVAPTPLQGRLVGFNEQMAKAAGLVEILVEFNDPEKHHPLGSFLEGTALVESAEKTIAIPESALLRTAEGNCVYVVNEKYLFRTPVTIGAVDEGFVEIKDGIYAGDQVASHPVMSLWLAELAAVKGGQSCCLTKPIAP